MALPPQPNPTHPVGLTDALQKLQAQMDLVRESMKTATGTALTDLGKQLQQISADAAEAKSQLAAAGKGWFSPTFAANLKKQFNEMMSQAAVLDQRGAAKGQKDREKEETDNLKKQAGREAAQKKQDALDAKQDEKPEGKKQSGGSPDAATEAVGLSDALGVLRGNLIALDLGGMIAASKGFVEALSPAAVQVFNFAMRDLSATVGSALLPAFQVITGVVREAAGAIAPAMHALAPVISQLAQAFGGVLLSAVQSVVQVLQGLLPAAGLGAMFEVLMYALDPVVIAMQLLAGILEPFGDIINTATSLVGEAFTAFEAVIRALAVTIGQVISGFLGGDHKSAMDAMTTAIHQVIRGLLLFTTYLTDLLGIGKEFRANLATAGASSTGDHSQDADKAAPLNAHIASLEQISKDIAVAAATAGAGGDGGKTDTQWLADTFKEVSKISAMDLEGKIRSAVEYAIEAAWAKIKSGADGIVKDFQGAGTGIQDAWNRGGVSGNGGIGSLIGEIFNPGSYRP